MKMSQKIQALIDELGQEKNHESRNRILSHLKDAKAHAVEREVTVPPSLAQTAPTTATRPYDSCTCVPGARDRGCPVHGDKP